MSANAIIFAASIYAITTISIEYGNLKFLVFK